jgi:hypothetical protein
MMPINMNRSDSEDTWTNRPEFGATPGHQQVILSKMKRIGPMIVEIA